MVKGLSTYLDKLFNYAMRDYLSKNFAMNIEGLGDYPDFFALIVTVLFALAIAVGAKESSRLNNVFTFLNLSVVVFVIIAGLFKGRYLSHIPIFI